MIEPTPEQEQRAKWDLLLLDLELRAEQVRQLKRLEPWRAYATIAASGTAIAGVILGVAHLINK